MPKRACFAIKGEAEFRSVTVPFLQSEETCRRGRRNTCGLAQMEFQKRPRYFRMRRSRKSESGGRALAKWLRNVYAYAQDEAVTKGKKWAGLFKLGQGRSNRKLTRMRRKVRSAQKPGTRTSTKDAPIGITEIGARCLGRKKFSEITWGSGLQAPGQG